MHVEVVTKRINRKGPKRWFGGMILGKRVSLYGFEHCLGALWVVITEDCVALTVTQAGFGQRSRAAMGKISG